jgi:hypothetical protein
MPGINIPNREKALAPKVKWVSLKNEKIESHHPKNQSSDLISLSKILTESSDQRYEVLRWNWCDSKIIVEIQKRKILVDEEEAYVLMLKDLSKVIETEEIKAS